MPQKDNEKRREYNRLYYGKNKEKMKCEHHNRRSRCKDCGGGSICEHERRRTYCKDCGGSQICEHERIRSSCKDCGGSQICEHERIRSSCKDCGGSQICEHERIRSRCKPCGGSEICEHERIRSSCKDCGGSQICEHDKRRSRCKPCGGSEICEHERIRSSCKDCLSVPEYLVLLQRSAMNRIFYKTDIEKTKASIEYLGCDVKYFKEVIEKKMVEGMTWNNIHLDHIKPVSKFNLLDHEHFLECCHYSNFQPLYVVDNLEKCNKWSYENELFWRENIIYKEYPKIYPSLKSEQQSV
jgi:hypothetical protein